MGSRLVTILRRRGGSTLLLPDDVSGLRLWLNPEAGLFQDTGAVTPAAADGDPVARWEDQSGGGFHGLQSTASKRATLKTGANGINGLPVVRFDGVDDYLDCGDLDLTVMTLLLVARLQTVQDTRMICHKVSAYGVNTGHAVVGGAAGKYGFHRLAGASWSGANTSTGQSTSPVLLAGTYDGAASRIRVDGVEEDAEADATATATNNNGLILAGDAGGGIHGDLLELLAYDRALDADELAALEAYLRGRAGL